LFVERGFSTHEYLPWFNLYNMNGRLYDPVVGRFLNVDPLIQDPGNTQSYNRYSYCLNNLLKYADPSGYQWMKKTTWVPLNTDSDIRSSGSGHYYNAYITAVNKGYTDGFSQFLY
jgi:RHS repeat-associated protein